MHRSHFHSEASSAKFIEENLISKVEKEINSSEKEQVSEENCNSSKKDKNKEGSAQPFDSFCQSEDVSSSEQSYSHSKSHKKLGVGQYNFRDHGLKKVKSNNGDGKFLVINSKKQKINNNYLFLSSIDALREEIKKY
jgi:hypothetical protein